MSRQVQAVNRKCKPCCTKPGETGKENLEESQVAPVEKQLTIAVGNGGQKCPPKPQPSETQKADESECPVHKDCDGSEFQTNTISGETRTCECSVKNATKFFEDVARKPPQNRSKLETIEESLVLLTMPQNQNLPFSDNQIENESPCRPVTSERKISFQEENQTTEEANSTEDPLDVAENKCPIHDGCDGVVDTSTGLTKICRCALKNLQIKEKLEEHDKVGIAIESNWQGFTSKCEPKPIEEAQICHGFIEKCPASKAQGTGQQATVGTDMQARPNCTTETFNRVKSALGSDSDDHQEEGGCYCYDKRAQFYKSFFKSNRRKLN